MIKNFIRGFRLSFTGFSLIFTKGIRPFVIVPLLINILLFGGAIWLGWKYFESVLASIMNGLPSWLNWLQWLLWPLVIMLMVLTVYYSFTMLANLIAAPFNSLLSERVEVLLKGKPIPPFAGYSTLPNLMARTVWSEIRKITYQLKWLFGLLVLSVIPGLNLAAPFAWLYFGAWMMSIEYGEYPMANHGYFFAEVKAKLKSDRWASMGMGAGIMLMTLIPVLNLFAMPVGVASGTALWVKRLNA